MSEQNTGSGSGYGAQEVRVVHEQVAAKIQAIKSRTGTETDRVSNEYSFVERKLGDRDGFTNAP